LGTLVVVGTTNYVVVGKKIRQIRTADEYNALAAGKTPALAVSPLFKASIPAGNPTSYVVVSKDTLKSLAKKFKTSKATLKTLNHLTTDKLTIGKVLILP
jgi:LysM repeat protein